VIDFIDAGGLHSFTARKNGDFGVFAPFFDFAKRWKPRLERRFLILAREREKKKIHQKLNCDSWLQLLRCGPYRGKSGAA
jgi:hypothetical protein